MNANEVAARFCNVESGTIVSANFLQAESIIELPETVGIRKSNLCRISILRCQTFHTQNHICKETAHKALNVIRNPITWERLRGPFAVGNYRFMQRGKLKFQVPIPTSTRNNSSTTILPNFKLKYNSRFSLK